MRAILVCKGEQFGDLYHTTFFRFVEGFAPPSFQTGVFIIQVSFDQIICFFLFPLSVSGEELGRVGFQ